MTTPSENATTLALTLSGKGNRHLAQSLRALARRVEADDYGALPLPGRAEPLHADGALVGAVTVLGRTARDPFQPSLEQRMGAAVQAENAMRLLCEISERRDLEMMERYRLGAATHIVAAVLMERTNELWREIAEAEEGASHV